MASVFTQARKGIKAKAFDAEGREVEFDVRDDEEQSVKLQETIDLLLAAGYFRARIKTLSPFDKVVGGMTWCIMASNVEVDVDLLFQENSTIGQKIALTEKIVAALPRMKCPHRLEPHQIQGLDFINIYPVVQWLVKRAIETREEMNQQIRSCSVFEFGKSAASPEDEKFQETKDTAMSATKGVEDSYRPQRQFKAPAKLGSDEETRVSATLLEFGRRYGIPRRAKDDKDSKKAGVAKALGDSEEPDASELEEQRLNKLMQSMSSAGEGDISTSAVGSIVSSQSAAIAQLSEEYKQRQAELQAQESGRVGGAAAHKRAVAALQKQIAHTEKQLEDASAEQEEAKRQHQETRASLDAAKQKRADLQAESQRLDELEGDEANKPIIERLRYLITLSRSLKEQESQFKATCRAQKTELEKKIEDLRSQGIEHIDDERASAIQQQLDAETQRLQKARMVVAKRNRELAVLQRRIDEVPSRSELTQYQRRFVELYEQINAKHRETKQYYTLYNTLNDSQTYMQKEVNLLNSIHENFPHALKSSSAMTQYLEQFSNIVATIHTSKQKVEDRCQKEKTQRDQFSETYRSLVDTERRYFKSVRDYEVECEKNEKLLARLEASGQA